MKNAVRNLRIVPGALIAMALLSCGGSATYKESNAKYLSALQSVLAALSSASKQSQQKLLKRLAGRESEPNPSLAKAAEDALRLPYYFFQSNGISQKDLSLAYSSTATIGETRLGILTRCRYIESTSSLGVYLAVDTNDERSYFYLDGIYDDGKKEMTAYSFYACEGDNQVNQYLEKNDEGFISVTVRSEEISKYDAVAKEFGDYLNKLSPTNVDGALLEAYNMVNNGGVSSKEPTGAFNITADRSMTLKAYGFGGGETTDFLRPLPASCEKDISKESLFNGEVFHTYALLPSGELKDITDQVLSSTAFFYLRVENKAKIEISLEAHNGEIVPETIKWARFGDGELISPPRGESIFMSPPDWSEPEPYKIISASRTPQLTSDVNEFIIWLDGNYVAEAPDITLSFA